MKKESLQDLYPMRVNPLNFTRGDAVKKIYMDNIKTPYVGVVTSVVPSTNKVEVQWPYGIGLEDPWDLVKVNPLISPPVVREDKAYRTYQNQKAKAYNADYCHGLSHYEVLDSFLRDNVTPVFMHAASLYNQGYAKVEAREKLASTCDSETVLSLALDSVYDDSVNLNRSTIVTANEEVEDVNLSFTGNSNQGYRVAYSFGDESEELFYSNYKQAFDTFEKFQRIVVDLDKKQDYQDIVAHVNRVRSASLEEDDDLVEL